MAIRIASALAAAAGAMTLATSDPAADTQSRDVRCLLIVANAEVPEDKKAAIAIVQAYLFGRMDALSGDTDWVPTVVTEAKAMEGADRAAVARACGDFLQTKGQEMMERGE